MATQGRSRGVKPGHNLILGIAQGTSPRGLQAHGQGVELEQPPQLKAPQRHPQARPLRLHIQEAASHTVTLSAREQQLQLQAKIGGNPMTVGVPNHRGVAKKTPTLLAIEPRP